MSSPLLVHFSKTVVDALVRTGQIELREGRQDAVIGRVAARLSGTRDGSLISSMGRALLADDDVIELFADDEDLKAIVDGMDAVDAGLRG